MVKPTLRQWIPLESASLFKIITQCTFNSTSLTSDNLNKRPIHRLCSLMTKEGAQSLWIDEATPETDPEVKYEFTFLKKHFKTNGIKAKLWAYKLIFVKENITKFNKINYQKITFLSCSIIVNYMADRESNAYLLYSIASIPQKHNFIDGIAMPLMNYYFHSAKDYTLTFNDSNGKNRSFKIRSAPFFQKNGITSFCMQSALATILNNLSNNAKLILPNHINEIYGAPVGSELTFDKKKVLKVIKNKRLHAGQISFDQKNTEALFEFLFRKFGWPPSASIYPWMESGFPGFIVFHTRSGVLHVVPMIGHTLNTDSWQPEADIRYSHVVRFHFRSVSAWVDNFIIHDDNFGMYLCYPTAKLSERKDVRYKHKEKGRTLRKSKRKYLIDHIIFITRENIKLNPDTLEIDLISDIRSWFERNQNVSEEESYWLYKLINERKAPLVSRTLSVDKNDYMESLKKKDSEKKKIPRDLLKVIEKQLPNRFWLTEITLPDLYVANKSALISIVTTKNTDKQIFVRFPKLCYLLINREYFQIELPTSSHYRLFERPNDIPTYDW